MKNKGFNFNILRRKSIKKILLYACIEKNLGDDLFIYTICKRYPDYIFYISSDAKYGSIRNLNNIKFSYIFSIWQKATNIENRKGLKLIISRFIAKICSIFLKSFKVSIYVVGNAFKCYEYNGTKQSEWFKQRVLLTKNFFLLSTNFGPYNDYQWVEDFKEHFRNVTQVCFREEYSYKLFKELNNVDWAPDVVLSLQLNRNLESVDNQILISIIDCSYESRPDSVKKLEYVYEKKIVEICNYYTQKGYIVKLLTANNEQDNKAAKRIMNQCNNKRIIMLEYNGNVCKIFEEYQKSKYVIATRLHAIILAWLYRLPVIPIIYDVKIKTLLESYMFNSLSIDLNTIDKVTMKNIDDALKSYKFNNLDNLFKDANKQFNLLDSFLMLGDKKR